MQQLWWQISKHPKAAMSWGTSCGVHKAAAAVLRQNGMAPLVPWRVSGSRMTSGISDNAPRNSGISDNAPRNWPKSPCRIQIIPSSYSCLTCCLEKAAFSTCDYWPCIFYKIIYKNRPSSFFIVVRHIICNHVSKVQQEVPGVPWNWSFVMFQ